MIPPLAVAGVWVEGVNDGDEDKEVVDVVDDGLDA
jgi:hypothetical protein